MGAESSDRGNGGLVKMDSTEFHWVFQDQDDSDDGSALISQPCRRSIGSDEEEEEEEDEEDDNFAQHLIRTDPRFDSFDVEALEIPGYTYQNDVMPNLYARDPGHAIYPDPPGNMLYLSYPSSSPYPETLAGSSQSQQNCVELPVPTSMASHGSSIRVVDLILFSY